MVWGGKEMNLVITSEAQSSSDKRRDLIGGVTSSIREGLSAGDYIKVNLTGLGEEDRRLVQDYIRTVLGENDKRHTTTLEGDIYTITGTI